MFQTMIWNKENTNCIVRPPEEEPTTVVVVAVVAVVAVTVAIVVVLIITEGNGIGTQGWGAAI